MTMTDKKTFEELTPEEMQEMKIEFAPGCFDSFEGTQEELDDLISHIKEMFSSGEAQKLARPLDFDDLDETAIEMLERFTEQELAASKRNLQ